MPSLWVSIDQRLTGTLISANSPPFGWVFGRAEARGEDALLATVGEIVGMSQDQIRVCPACCRDRGIRAQDGSPRTGNRSCASPRTPGIPCRSDWSRRRRAWSQPPVVEVNYVTISSLGSFDRRGIVRRVTTFTCFIWRKARVSRDRPGLSNLVLELLWTCHADPFPRISSASASQSVVFGMRGAGAPISFERSAPGLGRNFCVRPPKVSAA